MRILLCLSLMTFLSCSDDSFRKLEELDRLRILAVVADDPEVAPGSNTNLRLFIADPVGNGRTVNFDVISCIDPGVGLGAEVKCDHDPATVFTTLSVDTSILGSMNTGFSSNVGITVPSSILVGRNSREKFNGVGYLTIFSTIVDGEEIKSFKRVFASDRSGSLNTNPSISQIELNNSLLSSEKPQKNGKLKVIANTPESYSAIMVNGTQENYFEEYRVAWYVSKGEFDKPKSLVDQVVEYLSDPPTEEMLLVAVLRDERGGVAIQSVVIP